MPIAEPFALRRVDQSDLACDLAELPDHGRRHLLHGLHAAEFVGVGEKIAFERRRVGSEVGDQRGIGLRNFQEIFRGTESGGFDGASDVEHGEAFGNDDGMEINVAAAEALLHVDHVCRLSKRYSPALSERRRWR